LTTPTGIGGTPTSEYTTGQLGITEVTPFSILLKFPETVTAPLSSVTFTVVVVPTRPIVPELRPRLFPFAACTLIGPTVIPDTEYCPLPSVVVLAPICVSVPLTTTTVAPKTGAPVKSRTVPLTPPRPNSGRSMI